MIYNILITLFSVNYPTVEGNGYETPSFISPIVSSKPTAVSVPKLNIRKPNEADPGFWQNVEYNRYGNKLPLEAHQFITPATYHMDQNPIRFLSVDNQDEINTFDEIDQDEE